MIRTLKYLALSLIGLGLISAALLSLALHIRPAVSDSPVPIATPIATTVSDPTPIPAGNLRITWLGVATLLIDDGETQLLTDGFFSRPTLSDLLLRRPVSPNIDTIKQVLEQHRIDRLAAVMPVHSHYDHAMDSGTVAALTGASVFGSESSANAARGAGLDERQIIVAGERASQRFGQFTVELRRSRHAPIGGDGQPPFPGNIDTPLSLPAPASAWREGGSYSIVIRHPAATLLVQGSAGFTPGLLDDVEADIALMSITGLSKLGHDYATEYWQASVAATRAETVYLIHWDDFTLPWGDIRPFPTVIENLERSSGWLNSLAEQSSPVPIVRFLPFARPVAISSPSRLEKP